MRVFVLKTCDACRRALRELAADGADVQVIDVRADGIALEDRRRIAGQFADRAINRASATWRGLDAATREMPVEDLLAAHPTVMKRPVIEADGVWHIGWKADVRNALLGDQSA